MFCYLCPTYLHIGEENKVELLSTSATAAAEETARTNIPEEGIVNPPLSAAEAPLAETTVSPSAQEEEEKQEEEKVELNQAEDISAEAIVPSEGAPLAESNEDEVALPYDVKPFALQPAAELEEIHAAPAPTATSTTTTTTSESIRQSIRTARQALEVVTDASATAAATGNFSQVPSPPLTPNSAPANMEDLLGEGKEAKEKKPEVKECAIPPTPVAEVPPAGKLTLFSETLQTTPVTVELNEPHVRDDASSELSFDVLDDHHHDHVSDKVHLHHHHHHHHHHHSSEQDKDETKSVASLEENDSLFWSLCKTTAVVSAAVVVLGLGLGRKRH